MVFAGAMAAAGCSGDSSPADLVGDEPGWLTVEVERSGSVFGPGSDESEDQVDRLLVGVEAAAYTAAGQRGRHARLSASAIPRSDTLSTRCRAREAGRGGSVRTHCCAARPTRRRSLHASRGAA